jgi:hypothetical protein
MFTQPPVGEPGYYRKVHLLFEKDPPTETIQWWHGPKFTDPVKP